ncbi:hypothetical protein PILCRDRAFT_321749 [Piloderma croceum F 1598]|uniref:Uncharacterized protein n=1 Tax=Piloderma croceum (strain F 1598) TaxID=765440 RepID=A0A0C3G6J4_PILCF|nr:hypothetical protein PILCRDRAFT_321749 [Piloderma croceum F 1598]
MKPIHLLGTRQMVERVEYIVAVSAMCCKPIYIRSPLTLALPISHRSVVPISVCFLNSLFLPAIVLSSCVFIWAHPKLHWVTPDCLGEGASDDLDDRRASADLR